MKEDMSRENFSFAAILLCILLFYIYSYQIFYGFNPGFNVGESPSYNFLLSIFGHSSAEHLYNNLFFIAIFGTLYELYTSEKYFITTFLVSGLFANLSAFIFFPESYIIGASGGAMGVLAALAIYKPRSIGIGFGTPLPMWAVLVLYIFLDLTGLTTDTSVANEAHLMGMMAGFFFGYRLRESPLLPSINIDKDNEDEEWREKIRQWEEKYMMN